MKHPLERYQLIASPIIRDKCVRNFDENWYNSKKHLDKGRLHDAIMLGFDWMKDYGIHDDDWCEIYSLAYNGELEKTTIKQQTAVDWLWYELNNQKCWADPIRCANLFVQAKAMEEEQNQNLKAENEELRERLSNYYADEYHKAN